jgi:hypothetical protein
MNRSARTVLLTLGLAACSSLALAATPPAASGSAHAASTAATNVQTPTTKQANKKVKHNKSAHHTQPTAKKSGA